MGDTKLSTSDFIILAAGAVMLIASFLTFWDFGFDVTETAWGKLAFPLALYPVIFGVGMAVLVALTKFANVNLPERVLDFTWNQIYVVLSIYSVVIMLSFLILSDAPDKGIGLWLILLGSIALVVGAVMRQQEAPAAAGPSSTPPTPF